MFELLESRHLTQVHVDDATRPKTADSRLSSETGPTRLKPTGHAHSAVIDPSRGLNTTIRPLQPLSPFTSRGDKPDLARNILLRVGGELLPMSSQAAARSPWRSGSGQFRLLGSDPAPRRADCDATPAVCRRASRRGREADHSIARGVDSICRASETQREVGLGSVGSGTYRESKLKGQKIRRTGQVSPPR